MALEPPLQVSETPETRARIRAVAEREGIPQAQVIRDVIRIGLGEREEWSESLRQSEAPTPSG